MSEKKPSLAEVLKNARGREIKLGADLGSGFFFCGSCELLKKREEDYDRELRTAAKNAAATAKKSRDFAVENPPSLSSFILAELLHDNPNPTVESYTKSLTIWMKECVKRGETYKAAKERYDNYESLMSREVVRCTESDPAVDENKLIVIVRGYERGKYWLYDEAKGAPLGLMGDIDEEEAEE